MSWITLTSDMLTARMNAAELTAVSATYPSSSATLASIISGVVNEIRGYVRAGAQPMDVAGKIPAELTDAAIAIARFRVLTGLPNETLITKARVDEKDQAFKLLDRVAEGRFGIEAPAAAIAEQVGGPSPQVSVPDRTFKPGDQDGI